MNSTDKAGQLKSVCVDFGQSLVLLLPAINPSGIAIAHARSSTRAWLLSYNPSSNSRIDWTIGIFASERCAPAVHELAQ
jgi:hypothetical protein